MSLYLKKINIKNDIYKEKLLGGLLYKKVNLSSNTIIYRILGLKFMSCKFELGYPKIKLFNFITIKGSYQQTQAILIPILLEYLNQNLELEYYDILPLYNRIGETYLTLHHIKAYNKKYNVKNPIFISCYEYYKSITNLFSFNIPFVKVPIIFKELYFVGLSTIEYKNMKYHELISHRYFIEFEKELQNDKKSKFYANLLSKININEKPQNIEFRQETIDNVNDKIKFLDIKQPFIFIIPSARSNDTMSEKFWEYLPLKLNNLGYDLFFNTIPYNVPNSAYKHCHLSLDEAKYMCTKASAIIGIRSGLMDLVLNKTSKIFCFYKKFKDRGIFPELDANKVKETFTLKQLPEANEENIHEYNAEDMEEKEILDDVISNLIKD